jgi:predicted  nucleic acid-binding Zn-ribbon protein
MPEVVEDLGITNGKHWFLVCCEQCQSTYRRRKDRLSSSCGRCGSRRKEYHDRCGTKEYKAWSNMFTRCNNPSARGYIHYGGKGIKICDRWTSFSNFLVDMGECPEGYSLDRIDPRDNYHADNCKWASSFEQNSHQLLRKDNITGVKGVSIGKTGKYVIRFQSKFKKRHAVVSEIYNAITILEIWSLLDTGIPLDWTNIDFAKVNVMRERERLNYLKHEGED